MAKVKVNPIIEQVRGKVGDLVFKRYGDDVVLSRMPDTEGQVATAAQVAARNRFRQAALYGKLVMADMTTKALYEAEAKASGQPVFSLTVADFFNAPTVDEVDVSAYTGQVGDPIWIMAHDDFEVTAVNVTVTQADGTPIEQGAATESPAHSGRWQYQATAAVAAGTAVRIEVTATDRPGHTGMKATTK